MKRLVEILLGAIERRWDRRFGEYDRYRAEQARLRDQEVAGYYGG